MTTLARPSGGRPIPVEARVPSPLTGARLLAARLREEAARHVAFSEAKLLFRDAASTIERLDAELTRATAELGSRAERPAR
jgi:hypothetical protein